MSLSININDDGSKPWLSYKLYVIEAIKIEKNEQNNLQSVGKRETEKHRKIVIFSLKCRLWWCTVHSAHAYQSTYADAKMFIIKFSIKNITRKTIFDLYQKRKSKTNIVESRWESAREKREKKSELHKDENLYRFLLSVHGAMMPWQSFQSWQPTSMMTDHTI